MKYFSDYNINWVKTLALENMYTNMCAYTSNELYRNGILFNILF